MCVGENIGIENQPTRRPVQTYIVHILFKINTIRLTCGPNSVNLILIISRRDELCYCFFLIWRSGPKQRDTIYIYEFRIRLV